MKSKTVKWGILGTGWIAAQFTSDLAYAEGAEVCAVGSRSRQSAEAFAQQHNIRKAYGSYEELARDPEVDIIYVATPHPMHKENVLTCLEAGKAVLCEKPFTVNAADTEDLIRIAREKHLFLMEAMWTRYLPAIRKVRQWLEEGRIGEVQLLKADFGFRTEWNPQGRLFNPELGGGALLDVGIYPISFASMVFGTAPSSVAATAYLGETGVDERFSLQFAYEDGKAACLNGAIRLQLDNEARIYGTKGSIRIPDFFMARKAELHLHGEAVETFEYKGERKGYAFEAEEAGRCLREGLTESPDMPLAETLAIMRTMDGIRRQWGLVYPCE